MFDKGLPPNWNVDEKVFFKSKQTQSYVSFIENMMKKKWKLIMTT